MSFKNRLLAFFVVFLILSVWMCWALTLISPPSWLSKIVPIDDKNPFVNLGPFGDAFGPIASLMATIAASGALYAFISDRHSRALQNFESNFFVLLSNLESITGQLSVKLTRNDADIRYKSSYKTLEKVATQKIVKEFEGRRALHIIVYQIRAIATPSGYNNIKVVAAAYDNIFNKNVNALGHYFRTIHHLYRLIDERCPGDKGYYARIIRAQLSNEEICLQGYNCIVGEGRLKFRSLAIRYSLFHNIHRYEDDLYAEAELSFFIRKLPENAFRFEDCPDITYDD